MTRATNIAAVLFFVLPGLAFAADLRIRTEVGGVAMAGDGTSLEASLGYQETSALSGNLRLMWSDQIGEAHAEIHLNAGAWHGSLVGLSAAAMGATPPPRSALDLTYDAIDGDTRKLAAIDRAYLTFTTDSAVLTLGRQAITWGGGLAFRPMDIVAPFAPDATDTSYKPGVEMIYAQYLFEDGSDIQAIYVPRPLVEGGAIDANASTLAILASTTVDELDIRGLLARDHGDDMVGLGVSGALGGAAWTVEWVGLETESGDFYPFALANISNFGSLGDRPVSYFAEIHHNGLGVGSDVPLDSLPADLVARMNYGQIFFPGQNFLALGGTIQLSETLTLSPTVIQSLDDKSALVSIGAALSLSDTVDLFIDASTAIGNDGSEFGGRETSAGSGVFVGPPRQISARVVKFF